MSGKRDSDPRPQPWQGCALPTELLPHSPKRCQEHFSKCGCKGSGFPQYHKTFPRFFSKKIIFPQSIREK